MKGKLGKQEVLLILGFNRENYVFMLECIIYISLHRNPFFFIIYNNGDVLFENFVGVSQNEYLH